MNQHCYRLVFNRTRGLLMAVAEITPTQGCDSRPASPCGACRILAVTMSRITTGILAGFGLLCLVGSAQANVVADPGAPKPQQATVLNAPNGVPLVNIQTPGAAGVSRNQYSQFDVNSQGVILNNSRTNIQTQLGGWVQGNPWLATGSARVILNEVNSSHPSQLRGFIEVSGQRAEVVIANPAGISVNGGGFINTSRATLVSGTAQWQNGNLDGYRVGNGQIHVEGAGLDLRTTDQAALLARAIQVNAGLWANELRMVAGQNTISADAANVGRIADASHDVAPVFALDVAALGGMYAGKIHLIGTEAGVGVRNAGEIGASAGELRVQADGQLINSGRLSSSTDLAVQTSALNNSGTLYASGAGQLTVSGAVNNTALLAAAGRLGIVAGSVTQSASGTTAAGVQADGKLGGNSQLVITAQGEIRNQGGQQLASGEMQQTASQLNLQGAQLQGYSVRLNTRDGDIQLQDATIHTRGQLAIQGQDVSLDDAKTAVGAATIQAHRLSQRNSQLVSQGAVDIQSASSLDSTGASLQTATHLTLQAGSILSNQNGTVLAEGPLQLNSQHLDNRGGTLFSQTEANIHTNTLNNQNGMVASGGVLNIELTAGLDNNAGKIQASQQLNIKSTSLENKNGAVASGGALNVGLRAGFNNNAGKIQATGQLDLRSAGLDNQNGEIASGADAVLSIGGDLDNRHGQILQAGQLTLSSHALNNENGTILISKDASLTASASNNRHGTISGGQNLQATLGVLDNTQGHIQSGAQLQLKASSIDNQSGQLQAAGDVLRLDADSLDNREGLLSSNGQIDLNLQQKLSNSASTRTDKGIQARTDLSLHAAAVDNTGGWLAAGHQITLGSGTLKTGRLDAGRAISINISGDYRHDGEIHTPDLSLSANNIDNVATLAASRNLQIHTGTLSNSSLLYAGQDLTLQLDQLGNYRDSMILAGRHADIGGRQGGRAQSISNDQAVIQAETGNLTIRAEQLQNLGEAPQTEATISTVPESTGGPNGLWGKSSCFTGEYNAYCGPSAGLATNATSWMLGNGFSPVPDDVWDAFIAKYPITKTLQDPTGGTWARPGNDDGHETEEVWRILRATTQGEQLKPGFSGRTGQLLAGGDMALDGENMSNRHSTIAAGANLTLSGGRLDNVGTELYRTSTLLNQVYKHNQGIRWVDSVVERQLVATIPAIITAGGMLQGNLASLVNGVQTGRAPNLHSRPDLALSVQAPAPTNTNTWDNALTPSANLIAVSRPRTDILAPERFQWPTNGLFVTKPDAGQGYLIETNPQFTQYSQFISSRYMLQQLGLDRIGDARQLGDGYYEARLVMNQILAQTGKQSLSGNLRLEEQYRALMNSGIQQSSALNLIPGIQLTSAQMQALTQDIVWLETREMTLPDGQKQTVLVPQLYLAGANRMQLQQTGALIAANQIDLNTSTLVNAGDINSKILLASVKDNLANLGGRITADTLQLIAGKDLINRSGEITGDDVSLSAGNKLDISRSQARMAVQGGFVDALASAGSVTASKRLQLQAGQDIRVSGGQLGSGDSIAMQAGRNIDIGSQAYQDDMRITGKGTVSENKHTRQQGSEIAATGNILLQAGQDLSVKGSQISSQQGSLDIRAVGNIEIASAQEESYRYDESRSSKKGFLSSSSSLDIRSQQQSTAIGSQLAGNAVNIRAGKDLTVLGSQISAQGDTTLSAVRDINIAQAQSTSSENRISANSKSGFVSNTYTGTSHSKTSSNQQQDNQASRAVSSTISGENIAISAGRDAQLKASNILADQDIDINVGRNIHINTATETQTSQQQNQSKGSKIGVMPSGPRATLYGTTQQSTQSQQAGNNEVSSLLSANKGDLTINAGLDDKQRSEQQGNIVAQGADLLAAETVKLAGNNIDLQTASNTTSSASRMQSKSTTLGAQLTGTVGSLITSVSDNIQQSQQTDNRRLQGAMALKAGYDAYKVMGGGTGGATPGGDTPAANGSGSAFGVQVSIGTSKSSATSQEQTQTQRGTNIQAKDIHIVAREQDITATGAKLQADNVDLTAARDITLRAAENTASQQSNNKSSNAMLGVTIGFGQQNGISFQAAANQAKGRVNGSETTYDNTLITATDTLKLSSGANTTLRGAQLGGNTVAANIGGQLTIETLQNQSEYNSQQSSGGFNVSVCLPPICAGSSSFGLNMARQQINHSYQSAVGQSGIAAKDGGYNINITGNTTLTGAAITSTASADKNRLSTAGISYTDLQNHQNTHSSSSSLSVGYGGGNMFSTLASNAISNTLGNLGNASGLPANQSQSSQTQSVISTGQITLTGNDPASQQAVATLTSRDASTANQSLSNTLTLQDAARLQAELRIAQENAQAGQLVGSVAFGIAGDIGQKNQWADSSPEKVILHGIAGMVQASVAKQNVGVGLAAAVTNEVLSKSINDYIEAQLPYPADASDEQKRRISQSRKALGEAAAQLLGATGAALAGGSGSQLSQGAAVALNADRNNRQLHPDEQKWIKDRAKAFARKLGITEEQAISRLAQQALREVDNAWAGYLGGKVDQAASDYLKQEGSQSTFIAEDGSRQALFTVKNGEQFNGVKYSYANMDKDSLNFYKQYVQPGKVNGAAAAIASVTWQGTKALPGKAAEGITQCASEPGKCLAGVASNLIPAIEDGFRNGGDSLGGGVAAVYDETTANNLKKLYGSEDAPKVVAAIAISPAAAMVVPAEKLVSAGGKVLGKAAETTGKAWEAGKVLGAGEVVISRAGNISAQQVTRGGMPAALNAMESGQLSKLDTLGNAEAGALREAVADSYFQRNGFAALDGKCGTNCFDGVYIKGDQVIVNEVKPLNADGSIKLSGGNGETGLKTQMSDEWIVSRARALKATKDPVKEQVADKILAARNAGKLTTVVSGVNRNGMVIVKVKP